MARPSDTSPEAERVLADVYRRMPVGEKWLRLGAMHHEARLLHAAGVRLRNPRATDREIHQAWLTINLGFVLNGHIPEPAVGQQQENLRVLREVINVLVGLDIPYALGGSMASSVYGMDRYTRDADLTVEPFAGKESLLADSFGPDYYVSLPAIQQALRDRSSFNIINTSTGFKVDVFVRKDHEFERGAMARRVPVFFPDAPEQPIILHSVEDVILFKLGWYRLGGEISEQQWKDVLGMLKVQAGRLEDPYLDRWAEVLKIGDLLARARQESQV